MRDTMIKKLLLNGGKWETVQGVPPLILEKSLGKDLRDYKLYGNSIQNGTPTPDTPVEVESVGEKTINLYDESNTTAWYKTSGESYYHYDIYVGANKTITVSWGGDLTAGQGFYLNVGYSLNTKGTGSSGVAWLYHPTNAGLCRNIVTVTTDDNGYIYLNINYPTHASKLTNLQVEYGDTATPYEPYGKYKIPVVAQGKNLIDVPDYQDNLNGVPAPNYDITNICPRDVTISFSAILKRDVFVGDDDKRVRINYVVDGTTKYIFGHGKERSVATGIVPNNATSVSITFQKLINTNGNLYWQNAQLELGDTATEFEPYQDPTETNIYLDEPLRKIGDYADCIDFENGTVVRCVLERTFNGEENWTLNAYSLTLGYKLYRLSVGKSVITQMGKCNIAEIAKWDNILKDNCFAITDNLYLIRTNNSDEVEVWKAYLKEMYANNTAVKCYTVLVTPTVTSIELPKLPTLKGTTVLDTKTNLALSNMSVVYKRR